MHKDSASLPLPVKAAAVDCAVSPPSEHSYLSPVDLPFELPTRMYGAMLAIWHFRELLQRRFPLHLGRRQDFLRYLSWCASFGRRKYQVLRDLGSWNEELNRPVALPPLTNDKWANTWTAGQLLFGIAYYHYNAQPVLHFRQSRERSATAYWRGGRLDAVLPYPPSWQAQRILDVFGDPQAFARYLLTPAERYREDRSGQIDAFRLDDLGPTSTNRQDHVEPIRFEPEPQSSRSYQSSRMPLPRRAFEAVSLAQLGTAMLKAPPDQASLTRVLARIPLSRPADFRADLPFGVNLFGHARGELGIGEDVRLAAVALRQNGIPFCIVDVGPGQGVSQEDKSVEQWIVPSPVYAINLFCMTAFEHNRHICEAGVGHTTGRYNIGMWPWELPDWPQSCEFAFALVDEIWGISRYTAAAYRRAPCPVLPMTLAVTVEDINHTDRRSLDIPDDTFVFLTMFDVNSTYTRKNPLAVIKAFQRAFPLSRKAKVRLIVKASHVRPRQKEWRRFRRIAAIDRRIILIPETLRKPDVLGLLASADCFVSLHRAEGFGRSIAESLALGKPVIATGYSGNMDYCSTEMASLVRVREVPLGPDDYFHPEGQIWAEPDINHAAHLMRKLIRKGACDSTDAPDLSPRAVGARYSARLREIGCRLGIHDGSLA